MVPKRRGRPTLEAYDVLFELARGGMGVVYAARGKTGASATVAIKLMSETAIENGKHVDMFLDEARIASCVRDANVVEVIDAGEHEGLPFLVMEYVAGVSLLEVMRAPERAPTAIVCAILAATARGLHAAHETLDADGAPLHIVHRDVSPHNVLVGFDGRVKVTDFGVAAARGRRTQTTSGEIKGKVSYMSPEQITRETTTDRRADVWALGVIAWEALVGRKLFKGTDDAQRMFAVLRDPIPPVPQVAPELAELVRRALSRNPDERVPTADAFAREIDAWSASTEEVAAWMHAHFASRAHALEESFAAAAGREPTAVTAVHVMREPAPVAKSRRMWAPMIAIAVIASIVVGVAITARAPMAAPVTIAPPVAIAPPPTTTAIVPPSAPAATPEPEAIVSAVPVVAVEPPVEPHRTRSHRARTRTVAAAPPPSIAPAPAPPTDRRAASRLLDNPFAHP